MTTARRPSARHAVAAALAVSALLLSACSNQPAGAAATFGDSRITEDQLSTTVQEILVAQGQAPDSADPGLTSQTLGLMLTMALVEITADRAGVDISQGAVDQALAEAEGQAGGYEALVQSLVDQGIAPSQIESIMRLQLEAEAIGVALAPDGAPEEQSQAAFTAVSDLSTELAVEASPRFGTWDPETLSLGPVANDLSTPPSLG